jgi:hypothetical protein
MTMDGERNMEKIIATSIIIAGAIVSIGCGPLQCI